MATVQPCILHRNNPDECYVNAILKFLKERSQNSKKLLFFLWAKSEVPIGEPDFPVAAVSRGKKIILVANETVMVADHDSSKILI